DLGYAIGEQRVGHLGVVSLDELVGRRRIAVEVAVPALDTGVDKALDEVGLLLNQLVGGLDQRSVAGITGVGEEQYDRLYTLRFDREWLARQIALLYCLRVGEERRNAEGVGPDLVVGVAKLALEKHPAADPRIGADHDRLALESGEAVISLTGMGDQHRRVLLEDCSDRDHRNVLTHEIERNEGVRREIEVQSACGEELRVIDLWSALPQAHIETVLPIDPRGDRLIIATMLGFGLPVRAKADLFLRRRAAAQRKGGRGPKNGRDLNPQS